MLAGQPRLRPRPSASAADRWRMLELACAEESQLIPDNTEIKSLGETRAIDTIEYLGGSPSQPVIWVLGDDAAASLTRWVRYDEIYTKASIFVLTRTDICLTPMLNGFAHVSHACELGKTAGRMYRSRDPMKDISATKIRAAIHNRDNEIRSWLHPDVFRYIIKENLYQS